MARTYKRDSRGRFAGGGGGSSGGRGGRPATKRVQRGTNRLTRDNSGKITGQGGSGATARGGRLKTAAGNQRATQLDRLKGRIAGTVGKGGKVKGGTAKSARQVAKAAGNQPQKRATKNKRIDSAKVERILGRVQTDPARKFQVNRKETTKSRNTTDTRLRAMAFLAKAAGAKNVKTVKGTRKVSGDYGSMTRDQLLSNIAKKLSKPTMRSTAKSNSGIAAQRTKARKENAAAFGKAARGEGASYMYGRKPSAPRQTLRVIPDSPARAKGQGGVYAFSKTRARRSGDPMAGPRVTNGGSTITDNKIFTGRKSLRSRSAAVSAQSSRRAAIGRLAGTARLGNPISRITRGKARQATLTGGTRTTYGAPRFRR